MFSLSDRDLTFLAASFPVLDSGTLQNMETQGKKGSRKTKAPSGWSTGGRIRACFSMEHTRCIHVETSATV